MGADALTEGSVGGREVWERFTPVWHLMFLATLCGATAVALIGDGLRGADALLALGLAAAFALWHWLVLARNPQWWETRFGPLTGFWIVATALTAGLVTLSGGYTLMLYGLYPLMFVTLGWWGMVPVVVVTAAAMWAAGGGGGTVSVL
ncbi:MAG TPA: hypothetical protein VD813_04280, partial [Pseudonocardia sp.]|nr:hypothetical protein [Pseudonocardia sp.]